MQEAEWKILPMAVKLFRTLREAQRKKDAGGISAAFEKKSRDEQSIVVCVCIVVTFPKRLDSLGLLWGGNVE